jgi:tetratricopeptide (TPR) repeat protein
VELKRPFVLDVHLELDYAEALHWEDAAGAVRVATRAADRARAAGDDLAELLARVAEGHYRILSEGRPDLDTVEALALEALPLAEEAQDDAGLVWVWRALGYGVANSRQQMEAWGQASLRCVSHARAAGWPKGDAYGVAAALVWGPRPADEALRTLDDLADDLGGPAYDLKRAYLLAALGRFDDAWGVATPASERLREFGDGRYLEWPFNIAILEGDYERATTLGRELVELLTERGLVAFQAGVGTQLARCLCRLGRVEDATPHVAFALETDADGWEPLPLQGIVHAHRGEHEPGERLAREGVMRGDRTDMLTLQGDAWWDLADVLLMAGKTTGAADALEQALDRYERKKNVAMAAQVRPRLDSLRAASTTT